MAGLVVEDAVRARPVGPSAIQPSSVQPEGRGNDALIIPGVGGCGLHVGLGPVPTHRGLHPGSTVSGAEALPVDSLTICSSGLQAEAASLLTAALSGGQAVYGLSRSEAVPVKQLKSRTCDVAIGVRTVVDSILEKSRVPSILEVSVETIANVVPKGINPRAGDVWELVHADKHLKEETYQVHRVSGGAVSGVESLNRIRHVRLVVGAIQVDAVPA